MLKDFKLLEPKVTSLTGIHTLTIYRNQEDKFAHALHYLKEGLENNESIVLITDYLVKWKVLDIMRGLWDSDYVDRMVILQMLLRQNGISEVVITKSIAKK